MDDKKIETIAKICQFLILIFMWLFVSGIIAFVLNGYFFAKEWQDPAMPFAKIIGMVAIPLFIILGLVVSTIYFGISKDKSE
ncbi:MAG: hypothetical protein D6734_09765 [Candidatus Schekmanbacteria bacterium]|nr:MAG: hypothetical protein D6734_09765 [Candidatus Schekmanbacteria bacterium]